MWKEIEKAFKINWTVEPEFYIARDTYTFFTENIVENLHTDVLVMDLITKKMNMTYITTIGDTISLRLNQLALEVNENK